MLLKRILSALVFVPLLLIGMFVGRFLWPIMVFLITALAVREYCALGCKKDMHIPAAPLMASSALVLISALLGSGVWFMAALFVSLMLHTLWLLAAKPDVTAFAFSAFGVIWIAWPLSALLSLQLMSNPDWHYLLLCFVIPWLTDTGAYFVGRLIGKHKMAPVISPKKSWEGAVGGLICGVLIVLLYNKLFLDLPVLLMLIIGVVGSVVGQLGDLVESWIKRWAGVKDSGNLLPGHGGILDRFDSMLFVAPAVMIIINLAFGLGFIK